MGECRLYAPPYLMELIMKKNIILVVFSILLSECVFANEDWTTWRKPPDILSIAFEDSIIWCGTAGEGVIAYNRITGEQQFFTTENGLINNYVYSIIIDENNVKWFGTLGGISRFDGSEWVSHPINKFGYPYGDKISDIVIDRNNVWTVTSNGIYTYDGNKWEKIESGDFHSIEISPSGHIWAASTTKIYHIKDNDITEINIHSIVTAHDFIKDIAVDEKSELLWYTSSSQIYTYDWETKTDTLKLDDTVPDYKGYSMIDIDSIGTIWLAHSGYCALYSNDTITNYHDDYFESNTINDIIGDGTGYLWIVTSRGVLCFNGEKFDLLFGESGLYSSNIASIVIDNENTVWCSHTSYIQSDPLSYFKNEKWNIGPDNISKLFDVEENGTLWGNSYGALCNYDGELRIIYLYYTGVSDEYGIAQPYDLYIDKNIIWVVSSESYSTSVSGFWWFDKNDIETYYDEGRGYYRIPANRILGGDSTSLSVDSKHNFWIGTNENGLYKYDGFNITQYTETEGLPGNRIRYIEVDNNDIVWFNVFHDAGDDDYHSLVSYDGNTFTEYTAENSGLPQTLINSLVIDRNNTKWIGTDAGVCRFDGETWTMFDTENSGLCDNKVNAIAIDSNNVLWFGTDNGISRYTGETITTRVDEENQTPETIPLITTYPNPFNPTTTIEFTSPESGFATISIYSMAGQKIRELTADYLPAGTHTLLWDGKDSNGNAVSSGIYITRLQAGNYTATGRMVLMK